MRIAALMSLAILLAGPAHAQNEAQIRESVLGAWQLERETPRGVVEVPISFVAEGDSVVAYMGAEEERTALGRVEFDGNEVRFPLDPRALMQRAMASQGGGQRGGAAGRAGGPPARGDQRGGRGAGVAGAGPGMGGPPMFLGTVDGGTIRGALETPRGAQEFVLRRVERG